MAELAVLSSETPKVDNDNNVVTPKPPESTKTINIQKKTLKPLKQEIVFNEIQQKAYDAVVIQKKNVFITGPGGAGKSEVIKRIKYDLEIKYKKLTAITSLTGISANIIGGVTLHSYLGIQLGTRSFKKLYDLVMSQLKIRSRWRSTDVLIIDEISMLTIKLFEKLEKLARVIRCDKRPFGGMQIVLVGDFCQLPPVGEDSFIFESPIWPVVISETVYLHKIMRQNDKAFTRILNKIRLAQIDEEVVDMLASREIKYISDTGLQPSLLYSTNAQVDATNAKYYDRLTSQEYTYKIKYKWKKPTIYKEKYFPLVRFKDILHLKIGAQVVYLINQNGLFNGSRGVVKNFINGYPLVLFAAGLTLLITEASLDIQEQDDDILTYTQLPLKLAFAISIHKSQGSSLDLVRVDFNRFFAPGQAYVALSRVRTLDGLYIRNFNQNLIKCDPKAQQFYLDLLKS